MMGAFGTVLAQSTPGAAGPVLGAQGADLLEGEPKFQSRGLKRRQTSVSTTSIPYYYRKTPVRQLG